MTPAEKYFPLPWAQRLTKNRLFFWVILGGPEGPKEFEFKFQTSDERTLLTLVDRQSGEEFLSIGLL
jgi:hypothetical protein